MNIKIDEKTKQAIESVLARDQRVELIPTKDGIVIFQLSRKEIKIGVTPRKRRTYHVID